MRLKTLSPFKPLEPLMRRARRALKGSRRDRELERKKAETAKLLAGGKINRAQFKAMMHGLRVVRQLDVLRAVYHMMRGEPLPGVKGGGR